MVITTNLTLQNDVAVYHIHNTRVINLTGFKKTPWIKTSAIKSRPCLKTSRTGSSFHIRLPRVFDFVMPFPR